MHQVDALRVPGRRNHCRTSQESGPGTSNSLPHAAQGGSRASAASHNVSGPWDKPSESSSTSGNSIATVRTATKLKHGAILRTEKETSKFLLWPVKYPSIVNTTLWCHCKEVHDPQLSGVATNQSIGMPRCSASSHHKSARQNGLVSTSKRHCDRPAPAQSVSGTAPGQVYRSDHPARRPPLTGTTQTRRVKH